MVAEAVVLTRRDSISDFDLRLISNDNAFLNDFDDGANNFDQRTIFARFDCRGGRTGAAGDESMFLQGGPPGKRPINSLLINDHPLRFFLLEITIWGLSHGE